MVKKKKRFNLGLEKSKNLCGRKRRGSGPQPEETVRRPENECDIGKQQVVPMAGEWGQRGGR